MLEIKWREVLAWPLPSEGTPQICCWASTGRKKEEESENSTTVPRRLALAQRSRAAGPLPLVCCAERIGRGDGAAAMRSLVRGMLSLALQGQPSSSCLPTRRASPRYLSAAPAPGRPSASPSGLSGGLSGVPSAGAECTLDEWARCRGELMFLGTGSSGKYFLNPGGAAPCWLSSLAQGTWGDPWQRPQGLQAGGPQETLEGCRSHGCS